MNTVSTTQPSAPLDGQIWFDTKTGCLKLYIQGSWNVIADHSDEYLILGNKEW